VEASFSSIFRDFPVLNRAVQLSKFAAALKLCRIVGQLLNFDLRFAGLRWKRELQGVFHG